MSGQSKRGLVAKSSPSKPLAWPQERGLHGEAIQVYHVLRHHNSSECSSPEIFQFQSSQNICNWKPCRHEGKIATRGRLRTSPSLGYLAYSAFQLHFTLKGSLVRCCCPFGTSANAVCSTSLDIHRSIAEAKPHGHLPSSNMHDALERETFLSNQIQASKLAS